MSILNPDDFVHLHVHSYYSLLDGIQNAEEIGPLVKSRGQTAVALTDHGYMGGIPDLVKGCYAAGVKPIIGNETYLAFSDASTDKGWTMPNGKTKYNGHFLLLAKNLEGYQNLLKLNKYGYEEGFYYDPRIDLPTFKDLAKGLVATSTCISSHTFAYWSNGMFQEARRWIDEVKEACDPDSFFLEVQHNNIESQRGYNDWLISVSKETGIPLVLTADAHQQNADDWKLRFYVMCASMHKTPETFPYSAMDYNAWMYDVNFARKLCTDWNIPEEAIKNTKYVADLVDGDYFKQIVARPLDYKTEEGSDQLLIRKAKAGLVKRLGVQNWQQVPQVYKDRIKYEFTVINDAGYNSYFLIVQDYIDLAKQIGCPVSLGRGSSAGSLLSWSLGITGKHLDPVKHDLLFERFLNPGRLNIKLDFGLDK